MTSGTVWSCMLHRENFYVVKNQSLGENIKNRHGSPFCTISFLKHVNKWGIPLANTARFQPGSLGQAAFSRPPQYQNYIRQRVAPG
jgi:hypothetical protein